jgi:hypothetical protein
MSFVPSDEGTGAGWYTNVKQVRPDLDRIKQDFPNLPENGIPRSFDLMSKPEYWKDIGGVRTHATFPDQGEIERVGGARDWQMGEPGALLHINVIPEEHEFLDWDLPFSKQSPQVQDRLFEGFDPIKKGDRLRGFSHGGAGDVMDPTGEQIYREIASDYEATGMHWDEAWGQASRDLQEAGIPGNKYLDQQSRGKAPQPVLKHADDFKTAPNPALAEQYLKDYPALMYSQGGSIGDEVNFVTKNVRENADKTIRTAGYYSDANTTNRMRGEGVDLHRLADWVDSEHAAGKFSIGDNRTRNFVVFDPKDLEIRTWNGRPLEPVEGDPFDVTRP